MLFSWWDSLLLYWTITFADDYCLAHNRLDQFLAVRFRGMKAVSNPFEAIEFVEDNIYK